MADELHAALQLVADANRRLSLAVAAKFPVGSCVKFIQGNGMANGEVVAHPDAAAASADRAGYVLVRNARTGVAKWIGPKSLWLAERPADPAEWQRISHIKLTPRMAEVLAHAAAGRPLDTGVRGKPGEGGLFSVTASLRRQGMLDRDNAITPAGRTVLAGSAIQTH